MQTFCSTGLLQKQLADAIPEHTEDGFERFAKDFRQEVSGILALQIATVEQNRFFDELALAVTSVLPVETFDRRFGVRHEPERKFDFLVCHANFPPILCATPLFSLKQRDYPALPTPTGLFLPSQQPLSESPKLPALRADVSAKVRARHLGFLLLAACGFSLRRKPPAGGFLLRLPFPQRSRTSAQRPVFWYLAGTRSAVPRKPHKPPTRARRRGRCGRSQLHLLHLLRFRHFRLRISW